MVEVMVEVMVEAGWWLCGGEAVLSVVAVTVVLAEAEVVATAIAAAS